MGGRPKRAELLCVKINTGTQNIITGREIIFKREFSKKTKIQKLLLEF